MTSLESHQVWEGLQLSKTWVIPQIPQIKFQWLNWALGEPLWCEKPWVSKYVDFRADQHPSLRSPHVCITRVPKMTLAWLYPPGKELGKGHKDFAKWGWDKDWLKHRGILKRCRSYQKDCNILQYKWGNLLIKIKWLESDHDLKHIDWPLSHAEFSLRRRLLLAGAGAAPDSASSASTAFAFLALALAALLALAVALAFALAFGAWPGCWRGVEARPARKTVLGPESEVLILYGDDGNRPVFMEQTDADIPQNV